MTISDNSACLASKMVVLSRWLSILMILGGGWFYPGQIVHGAEVLNTKLVISATPEIGNTVADLLTVELGALPGVVMLERESLARIAAEQTLALASSQSLVKLGALLGADGVVVIEGRKLASKIYLDLRIVSVRDGVALGWWSYQVDEKQSLGWAKETARQLHRFVPRLSRTVRDSAPISFVGFRSSSSSRPGTEFERLVNSLLLNRLRAESDLVVLERQKLLDAAFEKSLNSDDRKFWNGAYLLDGSLNPERIEPGAITLRARLVSPGDLSPLLLEVRGSRTNLSLFASDFVAELRRAMKSRPSSVVWEAKAEAQGFYAEAERAARWGFWPEARTAVDTALALGKDDPETRWLRLRVYTGLIKPGPGESNWRTYKAVFGVLEAYTVPPKPGALEDAIDLVSQLRDLTGSREQLTTEAVKPLITDVLEAVGRLLLKFYFGEELRRGSEEQLLQLRATMRDVLDSLIQRADSANCYMPQIVKFGPLWYETPEDGIRFYQRLEPFLEYFHYRDRFLRRSKSCPCVDQSDWTPHLCGWKWSDRSRAYALSEAYSLGRLPPPGSPQIPTRFTGPPLGSASNNPRLELGSPPLNRKTGDMGLREPAERLSITSPPTESRDRIRNWNEKAESNVCSKVGFRLQAQATAPETHGFRGGGISTDGFAVLRQPSIPKLGSLTNLGGFTSLRIEPRQLAAGAIQVISLTNNPAHQPRSVYWAQDRLWVYSAANLIGMGRHVITAVDGVGHTDTFPIPDRFLSTYDRINGTCLAAISNRVYVLFESQILVLNLMDKQWRQVKSPLHSARAVIRGNRILLYNSESVLESDEDLYEFKVLASVHRRPATTVLDQLDTFKSPYLFIAGGVLFFACDNGVYGFSDDRWELIPGSDGRFSSMPGMDVRAERSTDEALVRCEIKLDDNHTVCTAYYYGTHSVAQPWWSATRRRSGGMSAVLDYGSSTVRYPLLPVNQSFYGWCIGAPSGTPFPFSGRLCTFSLLHSANADGLLQFWPTNSSVPINILLSFPGFIRDLRLQLLVGGEKVFFWSSQNSNIWCIAPKPVFRSAEQIASPESQLIANRAKCLAPTFSPYDENHNGTLDPNEYPALAEEPSLCELVWLALDKNHDDRIQGYEIRLFDFNRNAKLEDSERAALLNAVAYYAFSLYRILDSDRDGLLEYSEMTFYCALNLTHSEGIFQRYDKDESGKLHFDEWLPLVVELLDRRLSSQREGPPQLPPTGRREFLDARVLERFFANPPNITK